MTRTLLVAIALVLGLLAANPAARASTRAADLAGVSPDLCEAGTKCRILMGIDKGEQPRLAELVTDILIVLDAPPNRWVHERDRPPATVTLDLAEFLRRCLDKVMVLKKYLLHPCLSSGDPEAPKMIERMLPWTPERERLMSEYLLQHTGNGSTRLENPTTVVTHWTDTATAEQAIKVFWPARTSRGGSVGAAGAVNVSCHYVVDRDGTIYHLMPEDRTARQAVGLNRNALCIENAGGPDRPLTDEQLKSDQLLIEGMIARHPTIDNMIGHSEYRSFENTFIFSERTPYRSDRYLEPGKAFLEHLRRGLFERGEQIRASGRCSQ